MAKEFNAKHDLQQIWYNLFDICQMNWEYFDNK